MGNLEPKLRPKKFLMVKTFLSGQSFCCRSRIWYFVLRCGFLRDLKSSIW